MAKLPAKSATQDEAPQSPVIDIAPPDIDLESAIADELLDSLDWSKVKSAMLTKVKQRFFTWLTSGGDRGGDRPVNISQFPELAALPSHDDDRESAA